MGFSVRTAETETATPPYYNWLPWYSCIARPGAIMTLTVTLDKSQNESLYQATRPRTSYLRYS